MKKEERDIELIERYMEKNLSPLEMAEFEARLESEPGLKIEVEDIQQLIQGIQFTGRKSSIRNKIRNLEDSLPDVDLEAGGKVVPIGGMKRWVAIAASVAVIMVSTFLIKNLLISPDPQTLFAENFQPYLNVGNATTRGEEIVTEEQKAYAAYDAENYQASIQGFEQLLVQDEDAATLLYLGNSYLAVGNTQKAEQQFQKLLAKDAGLITQAKWYLALTYLKAGDLEKSQAILEDLSQGDTSYAPKAKSILRKL